MSRILALGAVLLLAGCGGGNTARDDGRLVVVATTGQVADLAARIGGDRVRVTALMGPGIDPHLYKASAGDVERLRQADLILYNGLHLEAKLGDVLARLAARQPTLAVADAVPADLLIFPPAFAEAHDPHIWFDVQLWRRTIEPVAARLAELDPAHAAAYRERAAAYAQELDRLDAEVRTTFAAIPEDRRVLITAHDAFNYLGRAYGLEVRGLQGISTATEAGTADVRDLAAFIAERRIPAVFVESSVSPRAIAAVQAAVRAHGFAVEVGGELYSDALGDEGTPAGTYVGMVRHNANTIAAALRGAVGHE
ncbi:MAG: zinc ABC transporter substrate-binding protein [Krumholzibacteria bacterium]|nr:zinc ABC transporter substrate-binding protein [Candidatus Krumholzibacteria bacterium]